MPGGPVAGAECGAEVLAGRDEQLTAIDAALAGIAAAGMSVLLRGDPGMGKTALLKAAETKARDAELRVLRMTGAEAESGLPFAALHQVLWPLLDDTRALSAEQRDALESALGVREGMPPEGFTVAGAALTLLAHAPCGAPRRRTPGRPSVGRPLQRRRLRVPAAAPRAAPRRHRRRHAAHGPPGRRAPRPGGERGHRGPAGPGHRPGAAGREAGETPAAHTPPLAPRHRPPPGAGARPAATPSPCTNSRCR